MYIEITEQQLANLKVFLDRTHLNGSEVMAYVDVIRAITNANEEIVNKEGELNE